MNHPPLEPYRTFRLNVDAVHSLYVEECGNPAGIPVVFLHGGPGSGSSPAHRQFFDPDAYRIVIFDQRGAGRSTPHGSIENNTTDHLIADLEHLRTNLGISRWLVFGGSWGSTLALAYAIRHADRCLGLVLRGIFLARPAELDWFMHGIGKIFPEHWEAWVNYLPPAERGDVCAGYYKRLKDPDPAVHMPAARAWSSYEGACSTLRPNGEVVANFASDRVALGLARIEAHYFSHNFFMPPNHLLEGVANIRHLPCAIVQGRYDIICPFVSAHDLKRAWPEATLKVIEDAGHSAFEPGTHAALVAATEQMKVRLTAL
jgi:proline iminopeptidase